MVWSLMAGAPDTTTGVFLFVVIASMIAVHLGDERNRAELCGSSPLPLSDVCPVCGSAKYEVHDSVYTQRFFYFYDRKCCECGTVYTCPVSLWASVAVFLTGAVSILIGVLTWRYAWYPGLVVLFAPFGVWHFLAGSGKLRLLSKREHRASRNQ